MLVLCVLQILATLWQALARASSLIYGYHILMLPYESIVSI